MQQEMILFPVRSHDGCGKGEVQCVFLLIGIWKGIQLAKLCCIKTLISRQQQAISGLSGKVTFEMMCLSYRKAICPKV